MPTKIVRANWKEIRAAGKLRCRFDPVRLLLEFKDSKDPEPVIVDLHSHIIKTSEVKSDK